MDLKMGEKPLSAHWALCYLAMLLLHFPSSYMWRTKKQTLLRQAEKDKAKAVAPIAPIAAAAAAEE
jgi:hypothetical protein